VRKGEGLLLKDLFIRMTAETPAAFRGTLAELQERTDEGWQGLAEYVANSPNVEGFVAENESGACGFVSGAVASNHQLAEIEGRQEDGDGDALTDTTLLGRMWVAPHMRSQGIGQELIRAVIEWAREKKQRRVMLAVTEGNDRALRSYVRAEFKSTPFSLPHPNYPELKINFMEYFL
jgi:GNAT superfamily N-acetyltransferase